MIINTEYTANKLTHICLKSAKGRQSYLNVKKLIDVYFNKKTHHVHKEQRKQGYFVISPSASRR